MSDPAHTVWSLQRVALIRARTVIFSGILDLGGPPTSVEEERQLAEDARMAELMTAELRDVLTTAGVAEALAGAFPTDQRDYWNARVPALLSFGARTHSELGRLARRASSAPRATRAAAVFQLAASLLDWIGDEGGGGADVMRWVPVSTLEQMARDPRVRWAVLADARRNAHQATAAFAMLLGVLIDLVEDLPGDPALFFAQLAVAYDAELASFARPSSVGAHVDVARLKSVTPTAVVGELARLTSTGDDHDVVGQAVSAIAGIFGTIDDVADLSADLRTGALNTLVATAGISDGTRDEAGVIRAMRTVLATDLIEERSADVSDRIHGLMRVLAMAEVDPAERTAALEWLRTTTWRWIA